MVHYELMNIGRIKQIFRDLVGSISDVKPPGQPGVPQQLNQSLIVHSRLVLHGSDADKFSDAIERIGAEVRKDGTWCRSSLTGLFADCAANVLCQPPDQRQRAVSTESERLVIALRAVPEEWEVELSVGGMLPDCGGFKFGRIEFVAQNVKLPAPIPGLTKDDKSVSSLFARISVRAVDQESAIDAAENEVDHELAVLNALCADAPPSLMRIHRGQPENPFRYAVVRAKKAVEARHSMTFGSRTIGIELPRLSLEGQIRARGGLHVSGLLARQDSFAQRVATGYAIAGAGCVEREPQLSFLLFAIALESTVLGAQVKTEIAYQLSARLVHLFGGDVARRRQLAKRVSDLYRLRSNIVHKGDTDIERNDLLRMWRTCMYALSIWATNPKFSLMTDSEGLDRWFEDRLLGVPEVS
ncbi:MAG: hypothetical protein WCF30_11620 [Terracidiphilus sp.]